MKRDFIIKGMKTLKKAQIEDVTIRLTYSTKKDCYYVIEITPDHENILSPGHIHTVGQYQNEIDAINRFKNVTKVPLGY